VNVVPPGPGVQFHLLSHVRRHPGSRKPAIRGLLPLPHAGIPRLEEAVSQVPKSKKEVVFSNASRGVHKQHPLGLETARRLLLMDNPCRGRGKKLDGKEPPCHDQEEWSRRE
jgi:hypothetical protein